MANVKSVKAKLMPAYVWDCPGCGESNLDSIPERLDTHDDCNMDYVSVKCGNCNGSYIVEGSLGWLTSRRLQQGKSADNLRKLPKKCSLCNNTGKPCNSCDEYHPMQSMCPPHEVRMKWSAAENVCPQCGTKEVTL